MSTKGFQDLEKQGESKKNGQNPQKSIQNGQKTRKSSVFRKYMRVLQTAAHARQLLHTLISSGRRPHTNPSFLATKHTY
jgi:hypothetical protein